MADCRGKRSREGEMINERAKGEQWTRARREMIGQNASSNQRRGSRRGERRYFLEGADFGCFWWASYPRQDCLLAVLLFDARPPGTRIG